jgi:hypothetical protein
VKGLYFVKKPLYGIVAGRVERFAPHKAGELIVNGSIEPFDRKKHGNAPGAPVVPKKGADEDEE